jgi:hypothetical protein
VQKIISQARCARVIVVMFFTLKGRRRVYGDWVIDRSLTEIVKKSNLSHFTEDGYRYLHIGFDTYQDLLNYSTVCDRLWLKLVRNTDLPDVLYNRRTAEALKWRWLYVLFIYLFIILIIMFLQMFFSFIEMLYATNESNASSCPLQYGPQPSIDVFASKF